MRRKLNERDSKGDNNSLIKDKVQIKGHKVVTKARKEVNNEPKHPCHQLKQKSPYVPTVGSHMPGNACKEPKNVFDAKEQSIRLKIFLKDQARCSVVFSP